MSSTTCVVRDNARTSLHECRQINRDTLLKTKRKCLEDALYLERNVRHEEILLIGNKLKNKSICVNDLALLKFAFIQSSNNIVTFLKIKGTLHSLVRELTSNKTNFQLLAAECCCNLALGDAKSSLQVAKAAGPYLISLLSGCNYSLVNISVWTLGNLVGIGDKTCKAVLSQGFLGKLLQLFKDYNTAHHVTELQIQEEIRQNTHKALVNLLRYGLSILSEVEIKLIVKTVAAANLTSSTTSDIWVCQFLISSLDDNEIALTDSNVHTKCLDFLATADLNDTSVKSITFALRTVANLVSEPSGNCCLNVMSNIKLLQVITQKIFSSFYPHLVKELGWFLGNVINHPSPHVQESLQEYNFDFEIFESQFTSLTKERTLV